MTTTTTTTTSTTSSTNAVEGGLQVTELDNWGFEILVANPSWYDATQLEDWKLWIENSAGETLQGSWAATPFSLFSPRYNLSENETVPFFQRSWGLYQEALQNVQLSFSSLQPNQASLLEISGFLFPESLKTSLRIIAPLGFEWFDDFDANLRWFLPACTDSGADDDRTCDPFSNLPRSDLWPELEDELPNELVWISLSFVGGVDYALRHLVHLPWHSPRTSGNTFFIELAFDQSEAALRLGAVAIESPRVATTTTTTTTTSTATSTTTTVTTTTTSTTTSTTTTTTTMPREIVCMAQFLNTSIGWAVRGAKNDDDLEVGGMLMRTENSGTQWYEMTTGDPRFLGFQFADAVHGWAVGEHGVIWHTNDTGVEWWPQTSNTTNKLLAVHLVAPNNTRTWSGARGRQHKRTVEVGWAVGSEGSILRFDEDLGWQDWDGPTELELAAVFFLNQELGWIVGEEGAIFRTQDGGLSWEAQESGLSEYIYRVYFEDDLIGWAFAGEGIVLRTVNGGVTWLDWN